MKNSKPSRKIKHLANELASRPTALEPAFGTGHRPCTRLFRHPTSGPEAVVGRIWTLDGISQVSGLSRRHLAASRKTIQTNAVAMTAKRKRDRGETLRIADGTKADVRRISNRNPSQNHPRRKPSLLPPHREARNCLISMCLGRLRKYPLTPRGCQAGETTESRAAAKIGGSSRKTRKSGDLAFSSQFLRPFQPIHETRLGCPPSGRPFRQ